MPSREANGRIARAAIPLVVIMLLIAVGSSLARASGLLTRALDARADSVDLDNPYVRVLRNASACGSAHTEGFGTRVIVALTTVTIHGSKGEFHLERGQIAVFLSSQSYEPPTGEYFEVALKATHPRYEGPDEWHEPQKNTILYEDEQFRVFEERLAPGDTRELHSHSQRVVVRLNEVHLTDPRFKRKERPGAGVQVPNTVKFAEPIVHVVHNLSAIPLFNIVIEFKVPHVPGDRAGAK